MIIFWTLSAVMIIAALAILAPALLRKHQSAMLDRNDQNVIIARERLAELDRELASGHITEEEHAGSRRELEQVLLQDLESESKPGRQPKGTSVYGKRGLLALVVLVPLVSIVIYQQLGSPALIAQSAHVPTKPAAESVSAPVGSMADLAIKLRQRLEQESPDDANGWYLLGRTYMTMKDYPQAAQAFERTYQLAGEQPAIMLSLADALTMSQQDGPSERAVELVERALVLAPQNTTALWMAGLIAEGRGEYQKALDLWTKLEPLLAGSPQDKQQLASQIARVSLKAGIEPPLPGDTPATVPTPETVQNARVKLNVTLAPALQQTADKNATVFIYAKAMNGPRFPLAAVRYRVSDLPLAIALDDSNAVMPSAKLSDFPLVKVGARVSTSGDAIARPGDLIGELPDIRVDNDAIANVVIDSVIP